MTESAQTVHTQAKLLQLRPDSHSSFSTQPATPVCQDLTGAVRCAGQLGDVMKESAQISHTYSRAKLQQLRPDSHFFRDTTIHVHVPAGATPKDGPSAGCTLITALLSLALDVPVQQDLAMTGTGAIVACVLASHRLVLSSVCELPICSGPFM